MGLGRPSPIKNQNLGRNPDVIIDSLINEDANETRASAPLLRMQWVTQSKPVALAGLLHTLSHRCAPISAPDFLLTTPTNLI